MQHFPSVTASSSDITFDGVYSASWKLKSDAISYARITLHPFLLFLRPNVLLSEDEDMMRSDKSFLFNM